MTATMAGRSTAAKDPGASARARSNHASPGGCKASVLCISLWMLSTNRLVTCRAAVDERSCGKVDNSQGASLAQVGSFHRPKLEGGIHSATCEFCYPSDGSAATDLLLFRCSGCPAQTGSARVHGCSRLRQGADDCRRCRQVTVRDTSGPSASGAGSRCRRQHAFQVGGPGFATVQEGP